LATLAEVLSYDGSYESPFYTEEKIARPDKKCTLGGKEDDITVLVAQVKLH
jgi:hypothetical protein